jgi:hypothetical protein
VRRFALIVPLLAAALPAFAHDMSSMQGMEMHDMTMPMPMTGALGPYAMAREASGTSWQPDTAPHHGLHAEWDGWELMGHAMLAGVFDSQSGARGDTQWFAEGMAMGAARRNFGDGDVLNLRLMLSPDPFMGRRGYPLNLASGETADGTTPLIDRQHPHDLVMELSGSFSHALSNSDSVFVYAGYPGEPAFGPPAFLHRASGMDIPEAPISHHWLDSTHITFGVATLGVVRGDWKLEVSRFTGREPDEDRFDFDEARFDSTSARLSWNPDEHWSLEASWAYLVSPEQLMPAENETRYAASAEYVDGPFAATLAWGHKLDSDAVLLEGEYRLDDWTFFLRAEHLSNSEFFGDADKVSPGLIHDWRLGEHMRLGLGGLYDFDFGPGADAHGAMLFARIVAD